MTVPMTFAASRGLARMRKVLAAGVPLTARKLCEASHVSFNSWKNHYRAFLVERGEIHVAGWERHQYGWAPQYGAGQGETPPRPKAPLPKESTKLWRERTGYNEFRKAQRRLAKPQDRALTALLGLPAKYQKRHQARNQEKHA